jgi:hypothetical protein
VFEGKQEDVMSLGKDAGREQDNRVIHSAGVEVLQHGDAAGPRASVPDV